MAPQEFLQQTPERHPLFDPTCVPCGGLSLFVPDWMHTKCLGTDANLLGSAIAFLAKDYLPGSVDENMALIWEGVQEQYTTQKTACRLSHLTFKMVKNDPFPRLSVKAMEIRWLLPALEPLLRAWAPGDARVAWFHRLVVMSMEADKLVFGCKSFRLGLEEGRRLKDLLFHFSQTLTTLARNFHQAGLAYCNFIPKNHYLCHLGVSSCQTGISPRVGFCFQGEDFMALVKRLCVGSSRGVASAQLCTKVVGKYLRGLDIMLQQQED